MIPVRGLSLWKKFRTMNSYGMPLKQWFNWHVRLTCRVLLLLTTFRPWLREHRAEHLHSHRLFWDACWLPPLPTCCAQAATQLVKCTFQRLPSMRRAMRLTLCTTSFQRMAANRLSFQVTSSLQQIFPWSSYQVSTLLYHTRGYQKVARPCLTTTAMRWSGDIWQRAMGMHAWHRGCWHPQRTWRIYTWSIYNLVLN